MILALMSLMMHRALIPILLMALIPILLITIIADTALILVQNYLVMVHIRVQVLVLHSVLVFGHADLREDIDGKDHHFRG